MVTFYPDVSCWAWVMAHAALISLMWLNACGKFRVISPLAGVLFLKPCRSSPVTFCRSTVLVAEVCLQRDCHQRQNAVHA